MTRARSGVIARRTSSFAWKLTSSTVRDICSTLPLLGYVDGFESHSGAECVFFDLLVAMLKLNVRDGAELYRVREPLA